MDLNTTNHAPHFPYPYMKGMFQECVMSLIDMMEIIYKGGKFFIPFLNYMEGQSYQIFSDLIILNMEEF